MPADDLAFIESAYARLLGRPVDPQALRLGLQSLARGESRASLIERLRGSDEAAARQGQGATVPALPTIDSLLAIGPTSRFVQQSWWLLCRRMPASEELESATAWLAAHPDRLAWLRQLYRGSGEPDSALADSERLELEESELTGRQRAELQRLLAVGDSAFTHLAYWRLLGRAPDGGAKAAWRSRLSAGEARQHLLHELLRSPEGRAGGATLAGLLPPPTLPARLLHRLLTRLKLGWRRFVQLLAAQFTRHRTEREPRT